MPTTPNCLRAPIDHDHRLGRVGRSVGLWLLAALVAYADGLASGPGAPPRGGSGTVGASCLFKSGFGDGVSLDLTPTEGKLRGTDAVTGFSWEAFATKTPGIEFVRLGQLGRIPEDIDFEIVDEGGERGRVLRMRCFRNSVTVGAPTRPLLDVHFSKTAPFKQAYVRFRMKLDPNYRLAMQATNKWFQIMETKSVTGADGFRKTLAIRVERDGDRFYPLLEWRLLEAGMKNQKVIKPLWQEANRAVGIPFGEWFDVEIFLRAGSAGEGRFMYAINGRTVFDVRDRELGGDAPLALWGFWKLYQDREIIAWMNERGTPAQGWFDDLEYWDGFPPDR